jgi:protein TonB
MNYVSIFEKKWLDLVFEGKNQAYGAYQLRRENPRTTMLALLFGLLLLASVVSIGMLAARLNKTTPGLPTIVDDGPTILTVNLTPPPETKAVAAVTRVEEPDKNKRTIDDPTIVHPDEAPVVEYTYKPTTPDTPTGPTAVPGTNPTSGTPGGGIPDGKPGGTGIIPTPTNTPVPPTTLDVMPEYPGGIKNFYKYIGDHFDKPEIDDIKTVTVIVMFVIEKDGSITDVRVARDPGYGMAKEATRVLKSMKTKWKAGKKDGQNVRTAYSLPITVNIN